MSKSNVRSVYYCHIVTARREVGSVKEVGAHRFWGTLAEPQEVRLSTLSEG